MIDSIHDGILLAVAALYLAVAAWRMSQINAILQSGRRPLTPNGFVTVPLVIAFVAVIVAVIW